MLRLCCRLLLIVIFFLCCVFIMSQGSATTVTTITPPVTVVCSSTSISPHDCYHGPYLVWATSNIESAWCGSAFTTTDTKGHKRCCWPWHGATAATSVPVASLGLCQLCIGSSTGKFLFSLEPPTNLLHVLVSILVYASAFWYHAGCHIHLWGLIIRVYHCSLLEHTHGRHMCSLVMVICPHQECT